MEWVDSRLLLKPKRAAKINVYSHKWHDDGDADDSCRNWGWATTQEGGEFIATGKSDVVFGECPTAKAQSTLAQKGAGVAVRTPR